MHITATLGGAVSQDNESFDALIVRADKALYLGKDKGRNQVRIAK